MTALFLAFSAAVCGCGSNEEGSLQPQMAYETGTLKMGTGPEGSTIHQAGWKVSDIISNTVPGIYVAVEVTKGAMNNADNVSDDSLDLALISGDVAYDAFYGNHSFEGTPLENLCVLGACYQEVSGWAAVKPSGIADAGDLKGKIISAGSRASVTEQVSEDVFFVLGIDPENTEIYTDSISSSVRHLKEGTADASHAFSIVPNSQHESLANETEVLILSYPEEYLSELKAKKPWYFETEIPAGTYNGQDEPAATFGRKMLLCAANDMDVDLAYEIARALDLNGPVYTADTRFMSAIADKEFLCKEIPIPLHEGAENYYRELGYITE